MDKFFPIASPFIGKRERDNVLKALESTWISSSGEYIDRFEKGFSQYCGCPYGVATSNGTTALHLALLALDIKHGDEVIVPDLTFAATINVVLHANVTPIIVDVEADSWCIDPKAIEKAIGPKTKAIIPVHIYGQPCNMDAIMALAKNHKLAVIEDCAQAHGAQYDGHRVGSIGDIGCFSFYGNKIITTGEGGICVTKSKEIMEKLTVLRDHGMSRTRKYWHDVVGYNYRMTNIQAALGCAQLDNIETFLRERKMMENSYREILGGADGITLQSNDLPKRNRVTWLTSILIENGKRDEFAAILKDKHIDSRPFFYPLSIMPLYKRFASSCRNSSEISQNGLNLPTYNSREGTDEIFSRLKQL